MRDKPGRRNTRTVSSGRGFDWEFHQLPKGELAITLGEPGNEHKLVLDPWEVAAVTTLIGLWRGDGVLRLRKPGWELARHDIANGFPWGINIELDGPADTIRVHLQDTRQTQPPRIELLDITAGPDGRLRPHHSTVTRPAVGLSGDEETDTHVAIMLTMLRENGGVITGSAKTFIGTALIIRNSHQWHVIPGSGDQTHQLFYLSQPNGPHGPPPDNIII